MYYPCMNCRKEYDKKCINSCDYARSIEVLKEVLLINEPCASVCKNGYPCKGVGFDCDEECENHSLFEVDFDKIMKEYDINLNKET